MDIMPFTMAPPAPTPFPFLTLPGEVRTMIYWLLLAERTITLNIPHTSPIRYFAVRSGRFFPAVLREHPEPAIRYVDRSSPANPDRVTTGLLATCLQIYRECYAIPYAFNTFSIHPALLTLWLERRLFSQVQLLRSLALTGHMYTYADNMSFRTTLRDAVPFLTGLQEVHITMAMNADMAVRGANAPWLAGLEAFFGAGVRGRVVVNPVSAQARRFWPRFGGEEAVRRLNARWGR